MPRAIILDTETTDKEPPMEVIELAWKFFEGSKSYRGLFKPERPPKFGAMAVHHILMEDLEGCEAASLAPSFIPGDCDYFIGHNVDSDWKALGAPEKVRRICTLALARRQWPEADSHSLGALTYFTKGATGTTREQIRKAHSAFDDVVMCEDLLYALVQALGMTSLPTEQLIERLWEESEDARVPRIMTFGKHRGNPVSSVDRGYMNWYSKQSDPDPYLLEAFRRNGW